jgi:hypothetical protein
MLFAPRATLDDMKTWKFLLSPGLELRPLGRPSRNQSLYRLRYPGTYLVIHMCAKFPVAQIKIRCLRLHIRHLCICYVTDYLITTVKQSLSWEAKLFLSYSRNSPPLIEYASSLPYSQEPATLLPKGRKNNIIWLISLSKSLSKLNIWTIIHVKFYSRQHSTALWLIDLIYKAIILPATCALAWAVFPHPVDESLKMFESNMWRRKLGPKMGKQQETL